MAERIFFGKVEQSGNSVFNYPTAKDSPHVPREIGRQFHIGLRCHHGPHSCSRGHRRSQHSRVSLPTSKRIAFGNHLVIFIANEVQTVEKRINQTGSRFREFDAVPNCPSPCLRNRFVTRSNQIRFGEEQGAATP